MGTSGQITMSLEEYEAAKLLRITAENEAAALRAELVALRADALGRATKDAQQLITLVDDSLTVLKFAVANLPPEMIRGWPVAALRSVAAKIPSLPAFDTNDHDLCIELEAFARECDGMERRRMNAEPPAKINAGADDIDPSFNYRG